jgi:ribosome maturation factor RimP
MQADLERITQLAETVSSSFGLSVVDVRLAQQGKRRTLEVTIYRPNGRISLDDCESVSRQLEAALDAEPDPILEGSFLLEVQSPGIDRKLATEREFALFSGQPVEVKTKQKVESLGSAFTGKLLGLDNGSVRIENPEKVSDAPKGKRAKAAKPGEEPPALVQVEMTNIISVRLMPQTPPDMVHDGDGDNNN